MCSRATTICKELKNALRNLTCLALTDIRDLG
jgi:hypothetical protein